MHKSVYKKLLNIWFVLDMVILNYILQEKEIGERAFEKSTSRKRD
jgi:hypothetical protein